MLPFKLLCVTTQTNADNPVLWYRYNGLLSYIYINKRKSIKELIRLYYVTHCSPSWLFELDNLLICFSDGTFEPIPGHEKRFAAMRKEVAQLLVMKNL